jgi:hypothetical protein
VTSLGIHSHSACSEARRIGSFLCDHRGRVARAANGIACARAASRIMAVVKNAEGDRAPGSAAEPSVCSDGELSAHDLCHKLSVAAAEKSMYRPYTDRETH